jgi:hypothetical protein
MHRFAVLHRDRSPYHTKQHRFSFPTVGAMLFALLITAVQFFPSNAFATSVSKPKLKHATFTLDGVTVNVATPFLPGKFTTSQPGDDTQTAVSAPKSIYVHPYKAIYVIAVPYGTKPRSEGVPTAQVGGAQAYRNSLYQYLASEGENPQIGPTITLFGQRIQGENSWLSAADPKTEAPTAITEWVVEAGSRLWIIRITQELTVGTKSLATAQSALSSLSYFTLSSTTLSHHTTVNGARAAQLTVTPNTAISSNINNPPSWWNGSTCDNTWYQGQSGLTASQLGTAHYYGVIACGPRPAYGGADECRSFGTGPCVNEWECVELSLRYLYIGYGQAPYPTGNGVGLVHNYPGSTLNKVDDNRFNAPSLAQASVQGLPFQAGDVLSFVNIVNGAPNWSYAGHTALVTNVTWTNQSAGTGTYTILEQNSVSSGTETFNITNWILGDESWSTGDLRVIEWLDPGTGGSSTQQKAYGSVGTNPDGRLEDFTLGTDGNIYHIWQTSAGNSFVSNWSVMPTNTVSFVSEPAVGISPDGRFDVAALGSDGNIYHIWQTVAGSSWTPSWHAFPTPPVQLTGTPSIIANKDGRLEIFVLGTDKNVYHIWQTAAGGDWFSSWGITRTQTNTTNPASFTGNPTVSMQPGGELEVFALGTDGNVYHIWQQSAGGSLIGNWVVMPTNSVPFVGSPVVATNEDGRFEVFIRGTDNNIYHYWQVVAGGDWTTNWAVMPTKSNVSSTIQFAGDPSIVIQPGGELEAFARSTDGNVYHMWQQSAGGSWIGNWVELTGNPVQFSGGPYAAINENGKFQIFGLGTNKLMYTIEQTVVGGDWQTNWTQLPSGSFQ